MHLKNVITENLNPIGILAGKYGIRILIIPKKVRKIHTSVLTTLNLFFVKSY